MGERHRDELAFYNGVGVVGRRELGDQISISLTQRRLRPCAADRATRKEGLPEGGRQYDTFFDLRGRIHELLEVGNTVLPRHVFVRRSLDIDGSGSVRARL